MLLTGCMNIFSLKNEDEIIHFINETAKEEIMIASISSSPYLLAKAGVLKGKKYTVGLTLEARKGSGVFEAENYSEELIVQDGNIITARGRGFIDFGTSFGRALNLEFDEKWYQG